MQDFQEQSLNIWELLREVDINPNLLRNRREAFRQMLGRPLSTSSNIKFFNSKTKTKGIKKRKPSRKQIQVTAATTKASSASRTYGYGLPTEQFGSYYAPPQAGYEGDSNQVKVTQSVYQTSTAASYYATPAASAYEAIYEETNESPHYAVHEDQIRKTCSCKMDNQCPIGLPGPKGEPGTPGKHGVDGRSGEKGKPADDILPMTPPIAHCIMCPQGEPGPSGLEGKRGSRGLRGARGGEGTAGRNGQPGAPGYHGPEGSAGPDGECGIMGAAGMDGHRVVGLPGTKGLSGELGDMGLIGDPGCDGQVGLVGVPGSRGSFGNAGRKGLDGSPGETGLDGDLGQDAEYCPCPRNRQYDIAANRLLRV